MSNSLFAEQLARIQSLIPTETPATDRITALVAGIRSLQNATFSEEELQHESRMQEKQDDVWSSIAQERADIGGECEE